MTIQPPFGIDDVIHVSSNGHDQIVVLLMDRVTVLMTKAQGEYLAERLFSEILACN